MATVDNNQAFAADVLLPAVSHVMPIFCEKRWQISFTHNNYSIYGGKYALKKDAIAVLKALYQIINKPIEDNIALINVTPTELDIKIARDRYEKSVSTLKNTQVIERPDSPRTLARSKGLYGLLKIGNIGYTVKIQANHTVFRLTSKPCCFEEAARKHDALISVLIENKYLGPCRKKLYYPDMIDAPPSEKDIDEAKNFFNKKIQKNLLLREQAELNTANYKKVKKPRVKPQPKPQLYDYNREKMATKTEGLFTPTTPAPVFFSSTPPVSDISNIDWDEFDFYAEIGSNKLAPY